MYVESIVSISETEERVRRMKAEAAAAAKRSLAEARAKGEQLVADSIREAEAELADMGRAADEAAIESARELAKSGEAKKTSMRERAEKRMDEAVALIVERIVKA